MRYDGVAVHGAQSGGGVFAAFDWRHLALEPVGPRLISKAAEDAASMLRHFAPQFKTQLTAVLGHYTNG